MAYDGLSGHLFVGDPGSGFVDVLDGAGGFVSRFGGEALGVSGLAVNEVSGDVYVADPFVEGVDVYGPDGKDGYRLLGVWWGRGLPSGEFGKVAGVAVDNSASPSSGDVYVLEAKSAGNGAAAVDVYEPSEAEPGSEGRVVRRISGGNLETPNGIAVSSGSGRLLVADSVKGAILAYGANGAYEEKLTGKGSPYGSFSKKGSELGNVAAIAVDGISGDVYVAEAERHVVSQYTAAGQWEGSITTTGVGDLGEPRGVAIASSGNVIVADAAQHVIDRFGPGTDVPAVETGKISKSSIARTTAVLGGTLNGEGEPSSYHFQYGPTEALGGETTAQIAGSGEQSVSASVQGLHAGTAYFYRLVAEDGNGASYGLTHSFETAPAVEALETGAPSALQPSGAVLSGSLKRGGLTTHYYFQYGATTSYGQQSPGAPAELPAVSEKEERQSRTIETELTQLSPNALYHYRLVATNDYGTTYGQDRTFTTSGPPRITMDPSSGIGQFEATLHAQINPGQLSTTYRFQYGETPSYGLESAEETVPAGSSPVARAALVTELKVGTTYHYRVVAVNDAGTTTGTDETFPTLSSAPVDATYATGITGDEAVLHAQVNPLGNDTHVYFRYGTQSCQGDPEACGSSPAPPGEDIGAGREDVATEATLGGLAPGTAYHYRMIASNSLGLTEGPERTFTTRATESFALPDGRAWEMVSPPDKQGSPIEALTREGGVVLASDNGDALTYVANGALGNEVNGNRSPEMQQILATRHAGGWTNEDIATPNTEAKGLLPGSAPEYQFFSSDLSSALVEPLGRGAEPPLVEGVTQNTIYLRNDATGTYLPVVSQSNTAPGTNFDGRIEFVSASPDLSHVVLDSGVPLTGPDAGSGLYEWSNGTLTFVSALPSGKPAPRPELGYGGSDFPHAISDDGSRVIWTNKEENSARGKLYLRDSVHGQSLRLDTAQGVTEPQEASAQFQVASSDGSRIFFTDRQRLTADATAGVGQAQTAGEPDLYECEIVEAAGRLTCVLTDLTVDPTEGEHANVQNLILGTGHDGASVYLVARGVLATNANGNGERALAGADNLYALHRENSQWTRTFIAELSEEDSAEWAGGTTKANTAYLTARVSPNGRYLAFMSQAPITGSDNLDANPAAHGARDEEVYLYDSATAALRCVSCNPSGARPAGALDTEVAGEGLGLLVDRRRVWGREGHEQWLAGSVPGWTAQTLTSAVFQSRYLSDEGRLYFNSPDSLVPAAKSGKESVYEYEPTGVGSCRSSTGGCVSLLSDGSSSRESAFLEATGDGSSVFFITESRLLPQDTDTAFDIYVARECTQASPCVSPPAQGLGPCDATETCRPAQPSQETQGGPYATSAYSSEGNLAADQQTVLVGKAEVKGAKVTKRQLTRKQKLFRALKGCHKRYAHSKRKRVACERSARKRYGRRQTAARYKKRRATGHDTHHLFIRQGDR